MEEGPRAKESRHRQKLEEAGKDSAEPLGEVQPCSPS